MAILNAQPIPKPLNGLIKVGDERKKSGGKSTTELDFPTGGTHLEEMRRLFAEIANKNNYYRVAKNVSLRIGCKNFMHFGQNRSNFLNN